jgi:hypothetical protein
MIKGCGERPGEESMESTGNPAHPVLSAFRILSHVSE